MWQRERIEYKSRLKAAFVLLDLLEDVLEYFWFVFGEVGEDLAVDLDIGFLELIDQLRVADAVLAGGRVDLDRPKISESPFLFLSIGELKAPGVKRRFFGLAEFRFTGPQKALRVFQKSFAAGIGNCSSFYSRHVS